MTIKKPQIGVLCGSAVRWRKLAHQNPGVNRRTTARKTGSIAAAILWKHYSDVDDRFRHLSALLSLKSRSQYITPSEKMSSFFKVLDLRARQFLR
jgi:hypothetical protein